MEGVPAITGEDGEKWGGTPLFSPLAPLWASRLGAVSLPFSLAVHFSSTCHLEGACRHQGEMRLTDKETQQVKRQRILKVFDPQGQPSLKPA